MHVTWIAADHIDKTSANNIECNRTVTEKKSYKLNEKERQNEKKKKEQKKR